uniref:(northern house mosquito) hypothetical protein n=1 Tax=Culex pipiens TaxID=7175 RepID=A0A8D8E938_CULPI
MSLPPAAHSDLGHHHGNRGQRSRCRHYGPRLQCRCLHHCCLRRHIHLRNQVAFYTIHPPAVHKHRLLDGLSKVLERVPILRRLATCAALRGTRGRPHHLAAPAVAESRGRRSADSVGPAAAADGVSVSGRRQGRGAAEPVR